MSDHKGPPEVYARLIRAMRQYTAETDLFVAAASRRATVHRTDLSALGALMDHADTTGDPATPGWLSHRLQLSAPATSAMLDRLEQQGHVERHPHPHDRRSVQVTITDHARAVGQDMFASVAAHLGPVMARRTPAELGEIAAFLEEAGAATREARLADDERS